MLAPHSEKRIMNIQIPYYAIVLFVLLIGGTVAFSIVFLNNHEATQAQISRLSNISRTHEGLISAFRDEASFTARSYDLLSREMVRLADSMGLPENRRRFEPVGKGGVDLHLGGADRPPARRQEADSEEIRSLDQLNAELADHGERLQTVNGFFDNLKTVMQHTPSLWPVSGGGTVSSPFGERINPFTGIVSMHTGIDIAWWPGSPVKATADGEVVLSGWSGAYGITVMILHKYGFMTKYAHLQDAHVNVGARVRKGQIVGSIGLTGNTTGYHLHYEVLLDGQVVNPEPYLSNRF
jgi:murein DD-endopeptidase MepM/ murein hydrolase activator NlpD